LRERETILFLKRCGLSGCEAAALAVNFRGDVRLNLIRYSMGIPMIIFLWRRFILVIFAISFSACGTMYATVKDRQGRDVMLLGHDPVAYFTEAKPVKGRTDIASAVGGRTYYFASEEHRIMFDASPEKFEPQYGGFCSNGTPFKVKLGSDPAEWEIVDGRLFIFGDLGGRETWKLERDFYIKKADEYWPEIVHKGWRGQSFKAIYLQHVPHYQTGWDQIAKWEAKHGKPFPKEKHGNVLLHFFRVPGWRAAEGYGIPAVGWPDDR
jgi:YHS domain-containing protein